MADTVEGMFTEVASGLDTMEFLLVEVAVGICLELLSLVSLTDVMIRFYLLK